MQVRYKMTIDSMDKAATSLLQQFDQNLAKAALLIEAESKRNIQTGSRSGKTYKRRSVTHKASAPGEYPKTDTGALVRNIFSERIKKLYYRAGSRGKGAPHGKWLEYGTMHMKARPWLSRVLKEKRDMLNKIMSSVRV